MYRCEHGTTTGEVGIRCYQCQPVTQEELAEAVASEREACARICEAIREEADRRSHDSASVKETNLLLQRKFQDGELFLAASNDADGIVIRAVEPGRVTPQSGD